MNKKLIVILLFLLIVKLNLYSFHYQWLQIKQKKFGLCSNKIISVFATPYTLFAGSTDSGLTTWGFGGEMPFLGYRNSNNQKELPSNLIYDSYFNPETKMIYLATDSGLVTIYTDEEPFKPWKVYNYTNKDNNLISNKVTCLKFHDNSIWLGTDKGLSEFSETSLSCRNYEMGQGMLSPQINDIEICENELYMATTGGIAINKNTEFEILDTSNSPLTNAWITSLTYVTENREMKNKRFLVIGTAGSGLFFYNINKNEWEHICQENTPDLISDWIIDIEHEVFTDTLWIATDKGLVLYNINEKSLKTITPSDGNLINAKINDIYCTFQRYPNPVANVFIGTDDGINRVVITYQKPKANRHFRTRDILGSYQIPRLVVTADCFLYGFIDYPNIIEMGPFFLRLFTPYAPEQSQLPELEYLTTDKLNRDGTLKNKEKEYLKELKKSVEKEDELIGTELGENKMIQPYNGGSLLYRMGHKSARCFDLCVDNDGFVWYATENGVLKYFNYESDFRGFRHYTKMQGLLTNHCTSISNIDGKIYVGHREGVISVLNTEKDEFEPLGWANVSRSPGDYIVKSPIVSIEKLPDGKLAYASFGKGIGWIDEEDYVKLDHHNGLKAINIHQLKVFGNKIYSCTSDGLYILLYKGQKFVTKDQWKIIDREMGLPSNNVFCIEKNDISDKESFFLGHTNGLTIFYTDAEAMEHHYSLLSNGGKEYCCPFNDTKFSSSSVVSVAVLKGTVFMGTPNGISARRYGRWTKESDNNRREESQNEENSDSSENSD